MNYDLQKQFFQQAYDLKDKRLAAGYGWPLEVDPALVEFVATIKQTVPTGRALDIGCGQGRHALYLAQQGFEAWGIDYIATAIEEAKQSASDQQLTNAHFTVMDILQLDFPANHFDVVLDWSVLDHIRPEDWLTYQAGIARVLRPDGFLILTEFSANDQRISDKYKNSFQSPNHYDHFFRLDEIETLFGGNFRVLEVNEHLLKQPPPFLMLNVLLQRR